MGQHHHWGGVGLEDAASGSARTSRNRRQRNPGGRRTGDSSHIEMTKRVGRAGWPQRDQRDGQGVGEGEKQWEPKEGAGRGDSELGKEKTLEGQAWGRPSASSNRNRRKQVKRAACAPTPTSAQTHMRRIHTHALEHLWPWPCLKMRSRSGEVRGHLPPPIKALSSVQR